MPDMKEAMAKKVQAAARGYLTRKAGGKKHKGGKGGKDAKNEEMQAKVIQAAFRKYSAYAKAH